MVAISTERAARAGVLVKDRLALEAMRTVTTVVFDKTGTLTKGAPALAGIETVAGLSDDEVLAVAAAAEADSEHPLARAIVSAAAERELPVPATAGFASQPGLGVTARMGGAEVRVGGPRLLAEHDLPDPFSGSEAGAAGFTRLFVLRDGKVVGALSLADEVRPESAATIASLHRLGVKVAMITGDALSLIHI